jgi:hypothetical protein
MCTNNFSDTNFPGPSFTAGRTKVHKIDTGNQKDKGRNDPEQPNKLNESTGFYTILESRV